MDIQQLQPVTVRGLHRGMADSSVLSDALMPSSQMRRIINMDTDAIGNLTRSNGYSRLGDAVVVSASNTILGLHNHKSTTAANSQIIAFSNASGGATAEAYYLASGTTWTNKALAFTAGTKIRAATFLNYVIAVNGTDAPKSWTGATGSAWGTTQLASAPTGSLIETFRQQVYMGTTSTDTIQWSSVPSGGVITWPAANSFVLNPNDGSSLTAMKRVGSEMIFWKNDYMYRFNGKSTDPDPIILFGTPSQECVTVSAGTAWFFDSNRLGIYGYAGGYPQLISKPVSSFLSAIPSSSLSSCAIRSDKDHVELYIGDVTVNGLTITKCAVHYTISTQTWTLRSYAHAMTVSSFYDDGTNLQSLFGTTTNDIVKMDRSNAFLTSAIPFEAETPWLVVGGNPAVRQTLVALAFFIENSASVSVQYRLDSDMSWTDIGNCRGYVTSWPSINKDFYRLKLRITGISTDADPAIFEGFSILLPLVKAVEKDTNRFRPAT